MAVKKCNSKNLAYMTRIQSYVLKKELESAYLLPESSISYQIEHSQSHITNIDIKPAEHSLSLSSTFYVCLQH